MQVIITEPAEADLEEIGDYIARDSTLRAESFIEELVEHCLRLGDHPERYAVFTIWRGRELRRCPHGNYLILYSLVRDVLEINHVVHSARDYVRILFPDA
jgi:plasmid stabilization system protein ParE